MKVYISSLLLIASSALGVTFDQPTLNKFLTSPVRGTRVEYSTLYPFIISEQWREDIFLAIVDVKTVSEMRRESVSAELKEYWIKKIKGQTPAGTSGPGGLIPVIEIPVRFPAPIAGIFGEGGRLEIGGSQSITFGGSKNYTVEAVADPNLRQSWFPDLKMEQHLRVNVKGTIGDKLSVDVDHDSKAETELRNKIRLAYTGREDEIVQKVEAGDIDLTLPATRYASASGKHKGLFGVKVSNQVGPLDITAIASKEQGEASSEAYRGEGARVESLMVYDYRYVKGKFYWLGEYDTIVSLEIFKQVRNPIEGQSYIPVKYWIDPTDTTYYPELVDEGNFEQLIQGDDYIFNPPHSIELIYQLGQDDILVAFYVTKSGKTVGDTSSSPMQLKLIKPDRPGAWYQSGGDTVIFPTWEYELKNFYSLGAENIVDTSISVNIWKIVPGEADSEIDPVSGKTYLELFGLDANGDGRIELQWIHSDRYLFFPSVKPFFYLPDGQRLPDPDSAIYYEPDERRLSEKYYMVIKYQSSQPVISLPRINIIEGSEAVRVGDELWQRGRDYDIDYTSGTVTLRRELPPGQRVFIDYQWAPLISLASKTFLGVRTAYRLSDMGEIGSTFLFRSVATPTEKPKPGEEPTRNMLGEIDGSLKFKTGFLTSLADLLPLVSTEKESELSISGEMAASFPDPNTKNEAYLDDMEGTSVTQGFPINFKAWTYSSIPVDKDTSTFAKKPLQWYNPEDGVRAGDIHEGLPPQERERRETVLELWFEPEDTSSWASIATLLSPTRIDLRNYTFLEIWVKGDKGILNIDLAPKVSEDGIRRDSRGNIVGYGTFDTEDKGPTRDGILDWNEDTGLDGVDGTDGQGVSGDDGNDDYDYRFGSRNYSRVNGTEGNQKLDTEDLDGNNILETRNQYFEYAIDLSDTLFQDKRTQAGWKLYRVPLSSGESKGQGEPDRADVKYGRIWIRGAEEKVGIQIYAIDIVGNRWIEDRVVQEDSLSEIVGDDEQFSVEVVSNVYDTTYVPPFDPGTDRYGRPMRESSLKLVYSNIRAKHAASCYRTIADPNAQDYTNYKSMAVWLKRESASPIDFFIRFGSDTLNYYEVRRNISHSGWEELRIELNELPLLKHSVYDTTSRRDIEYRLGELGFKGKPSLTSIKWISIGVANGDSTFDGVSGKFYVNELRLTSPKRDVGLAANAKVQTNVADLVAFSLSGERRESEFRTLTQTSSQGSKATSNNYAFNTTVNLQKFGLEGFSIPFSVTVSKDVSLPKYGAGNDVELRTEQRWNQRSQTDRITYNLNFSRSTASQNRFLKLLLDPIKVGASRSHSLTDTPTKRDSTYSVSTQISYSYAPKLNPLNLRLFKLSYFPSSIRLAANYARAASRSLTKTDTAVTVTKVQNPRTANYSIDLNYSPVQSLTSQYRFAAKRDLKRTHLYRNTNIGKEWQRDQSVSLTYNIPIPIFKPTASYSIAYGENHQVEYETGDSTEFLKVTTGSKAAAGLQLNIFDLFEKLPWLKFVGRLRSVITAPGLAYSRTANSEFFGLRERPSVLYQLGIEERLEDVDKKLDVRDQQRISNTYSVNTGLTLWKLNIKASAEKRRNETIFPSVPSNNGWGTTTVWPKLNADFDLFSLMGPLRRPFSSVSLASGFSMQEDRSGSEFALKNKKNTRLVSPSLKLTFKKGLNTQISYQYSEKKDQRYDLGKKRTEQRGDAVDVTLGFSFSAPTGIKLPLISKIRFTSDLDVSVTGGWSQDVSTQRSGETETPLETANSTSFSVRPSFSYRFSSAVSGSLRGWFTQRRDRKRATTNRDLGLDVSATFRF
ncbi:hypothetical protein AMJ40_01730 [candidate division TA06 bacterium DG_26]|uniref:Gliding motility protein SprA N-terminal domain-containing protein n=1 Tax=candidate division TA06 bacterium DG_26 TaxID=1703771 RepID=A0A0S7WL21_UNCT6|nr:MAG: hypothetical protein AMJ40_01730 [candidate division TA06 bacterium DG_26]